MTTRLTFLCAGATVASRTSAFPSPDEALDRGGAQKAAAYRLPNRRLDIVVSSPARSAIETADAIGLSFRVEPLLADLDFGQWSGQAIGSLQLSSPDRLSEWLADPTSATPGGEAMSGLVERIGRWMDEQTRNEQAIMAISHAAVIRAAIAHALGAPVATVMRIDVAPLTRLMLSHHGQWRLQELRKRR